MKRSALDVCLSEQRSLVEKQRESDLIGPRSLPSGAYRATSLIRRCPPHRTTHSCHPTLSRRSPRLQCNRFPWLLDYHRDKSREWGRLKAKADLLLNLGNGGFLASHDAHPLANPHGPLKSTMFDLRFLEIMDSQTSEPDDSPPGI